jgi:hypothetical protein
MNDDDDVDDVEVELVDAVVRLAGTRRLREKQLKELKLLRENGKDTALIEAGMEESRRTLRELHRERRSLAAKLIKKRADASTTLKPDAQVRAR